MINMIINYINNLTIEDLNKILIKNNIKLSDNELTFTYQYIKKNYFDIINNYKTFDFSKLKDNYSLQNYNKINNLINFYKNNKLS